MWWTEIAIGFLIGSLLATYSEHYRGLVRQIWHFLVTRTHKTAKPYEPHKMVIYPKKQTKKAKA